MAVLTPASVFPPGIKPKKAEIIQLLDQIQGTGSNPAVVKQTKAALDAVTPVSENYGGLVLNDPDPTKNGYYYRDSAAWVKGRGFPDTFAQITLGGTVNDQTGTVAAGVSPSNVLVYFATVSTENTGPMTISISGETARDVVNAAGNPLSAGEWTGVVLFFLNSDGNYQLLLDAGAAASAAQSATNAAASAVAAAAFGAVNFDTVAELLADNNQVIGYSGSGASVEVASGFSFTAEGFRYEVEASGAATSLETAGAVKINLMSHVWRPAAYGITSGSGDKRAQLQEFIEDAAEARSTIEWGDLDVFIDAEMVEPYVHGLMVPSNSHWIMTPNTRMRAIPQAGDVGSILTVADASNVVIEGNGARLIGDRYSHLGTTGEWVHGLSIWDSQNIRIYDLYSDDNWGDGFQIAGMSTGNPFSADIIMERVGGKRNGRQGLSLITAKDFLLVDSLFEEVGRIAPMFGIDIEPDANDEFLQNINIIRPRSRECGLGSFEEAASINDGAGLGIWLGAMDGSPNPISINIEEPEDEGSRIGFLFGGGVNAYGHIRVNGATASNNIWQGVRARMWCADGPRLQIDSPVVRNANRAGDTDDIWGSAVAHVATSTDWKPESPLGQVHIHKPDISEYGTSNHVHSVGYFDGRVGAGPIIADSLVHPLDLGGDSIQAASGMSLELRDDNIVSINYLPDADTSLGLATHVHHEFYGNTNRAVTPSPNHPIGADFILTNLSPVNARINIQMLVGQWLLPLAPGAGWLIACPAAKGARMHMRKISSTDWIVVSQTGGWVAS